MILSSRLRKLDIRSFCPSQTKTLTDWFSKPHALASKRSAFCKKMVEKARELEGEEKQLHDSMPPHVRMVLKGKRLTLYQSILEELGYPDKWLVGDIVHGFRLSGWMRDSNCFTKLTKAPKLTVASLLRQSNGLHRAILRKAGQHPVDELLLEAWTETEKEVSRGWIWEDVR